MVLVVHTLTFLYQQIGVTRLIQACGQQAWLLGEAKELGLSLGSSTRRRSLAHRLSDYYLGWWTPIACMIPDVASFSLAPVRGSQEL